MANYSTIDALLIPLSLPLSSFYLYLCLDIEVAPPAFLFYHPTLLQSFSIAPTACVCDFSPRRWLRGWMY